jgi:nitroreductase
MALIRNVGKRLRLDELRAYSRYTPCHDEHFHSRKVDTKMNEIIKAMLERRAIRKYSPEQITEAELDTIVQAGLYAPSAGGRQSSMIVVCQNAAINNALGKINKALFHGRVSPESVSREQPSIADDATIGSGFYGAPTVMILFGPKDFIYAVPDCCVMAENIMLAAYSLNIGSCLVMRAEDTFADEFGRKLRQEWGIDDSHEAKAFVVLGYSAAATPKAKPRKGNRVKRVS